MDLILQEVSQDAEVPIPDAVRDVYRLWRPTPLYRAHRLEAALGTRSRIFYKYEGEPGWSHKPNTAIAQAYYVKESGRKRIATETGAGQWGARSRSRRSFSGSSARCTWSRSRTSRSRTAAR